MLLGLCIRQGWLMATGCGDAACSQLLVCAHAGRWLTPGTEYAVTEKLPLNRTWYTDIETEAVAPGANNLMSTASLPAGFEYDESSASHVKYGCVANASLEAVA